jgi:Single-strand binding protein family
LGQSGRRIVGWLVSKCRKVYIEGRLTTREYEAKDGSGKRSRMKIIARQIGFLDRWLAGAKTAGISTILTDARRQHLDLAIAWHRIERRMQFSVNVGAGWLTER